MKVFLIVILTVVALVGCQKKDDQTQSTTTAQKQVTPPVTREERKAEALELVAKESSTKALPPQVVDLTAVANYKIDDLYAVYLGQPKKENKKSVVYKAPPFVTVSFDTVMGELHSKKVNYERCNKKGVCKEATDTVIAQMPLLYKNYLEHDKKKMSLKTFIDIADNKVASAKKGLDWAKVCKRYQYKNDTPKMSQQKCATLQSVVAKIAGKDMVAYGMTELLPSAEGQLNVLYMDILLQNAGAEFLYHVPALGDELASLGFYQFTMYALRKDDEATEGASIINAFVKDGGEKIPDSVVYLKGHEHHVAAFYFAVHNLSRLVFSLSDKGLKNLSTRHLNYQDEMVMYVAAAHHAPGAAHKKTVRWVNGGMRSNLFSVYRGHRIHEYAGKTKANLLAVYKKV